MTETNTALRNICITINNYKKEWINKIIDSDIFSYGVLGKEIGDNNTPHLQGYLELKKRTRFTSLKNKFNELIGVTPHIENRKGTARQASDYCKKDGDYTEWGDMKCPGKRTDLDHIKQMIIDGKSDLEIAQTHFGTWTRCSKAIKEFRLLLGQNEGLKYFHKQWRNYQIKGWQQKAWTLLENQTDRQILWIVDEIGNYGKTEFSNWLMAAKGAVIYEGGRKQDIAYTYSNQGIVVFDYVRTSDGFINYSVIESFKNGRIFSSKYTSSLKIFKPAKVIILANFKPDRSKLSEDRWVVMDLIQFRENPWTKAKDKPALKRSYAEFIFDEDLITDEEDVDLDRNNHNNEPPYVKRRLQ